MDKIKEIWGKVCTFFKKAWEKTVELSTTVAKKTVELTKRFVAWLKTVKWKIVWDHVTTGILILLMCSPFLILAFLVIWFLK